VRRRLPTTARLVLVTLAATALVGIGAPAGAASTPGTSDSAGIEELQRDLNALGCNAGNIDGTLGPATVQAVRWFQSAARLNVDGIVGPLTTAALTRAAASGSPACTSVPAPAPLPAPGPDTAAANCRLEQIKAGAQDALLANEKMLKSGPYQCAGGFAYNAPTVQPAGGKAQQVIELLKWNGTAWQAVDRPVYCQAGSVPQQLYARTCLKKGTPANENRGTSDAAEVERMQRELNALGCNAGNIDGKVGPNTVNALKWFQTAAKLQPDGIVGPLTSAALTQAADTGSPNCRQTPKPGPVTPATTGVNGIPCTSAVLQTAAQATLRPGERIVLTGPFQCAGPWAYNQPTVNSGGTDRPVKLLMRWNGTAWQVVDRNAYCEGGTVPSVVAKLACQA
jgi:peptidoglycan hydrolase-like protein with peptidoglycan-binding domain